jgi:membrane protein YdbS with pleckstrin-like domain
VAVADPSFHYRRPCLAWAEGAAAEWRCNVALNPFNPDVRYRQKLFIIVALFALIFLPSVLLPAVFIGLDIDGPGGAQMGAAVALLLNALWIVPALLLVPPYYRSIRYELHPDEIIMRIGIVTRSVKHVPFRTVTNLKMSRGPLDRMLGIGTLHIETAGKSGQTGAEQSLVGLADVDGVYGQVAAALHRFRGGMAPTQTEEDRPAAAGDGVLSDILAELRAICRAVERS